MDKWWKDGGAMYTSQCPLLVTQLCTFPCETYQDLKEDPDFMEKFSKYKVFHISSNSLCHQAISL